jgi:hypothetical protein
MTQLRGTRLWELGCLDNRFDKSCEQSMNSIIYLVGLVVVVLFVLNLVGLS